MTKQVFYVFIFLFCCSTTVSFGSEKQQINANDFVDWFTAKPLKNLSDNFNEILHSVPISSKIEGEHSPSGRYFIYTSFGKKKEPVLGIASKIIKWTSSDGDEREQEVKEGVWQNIYKPILHIRDLHSNRAFVICDTNNNFYKNIYFNKWKWSPKEDKIYLGFEPLGWWFPYSLSSGEFEGDSSALSRINELVPKDLLDIVQNKNSYIPSN